MRLSLARVSLTTRVIKRFSSSWACERQRQQKVSDPLRILFCGTDDISTESLRALHEEWKVNRDLVEAIEVVCMPPKPSGRGLKTLKPLPVTKTAEALGLSYHQIPTFTGWKVPEGINLVIAVSFGLFVPPRVLRAAKYGGLNVHPSWLPDLRGPAPTLHAMLRGDQYMGATLQTLDENKFDHGVILAQTPRPGIRIAENTTLARINRRMAMECADLLINGLKSGVHVPPYTDAGWMAKEMEAEGRALQHAPKMSKADFQIDWVSWTATDWRRRLQVSQSVWTHIGVPQQESNKKGAQKQQRRRVIFHDAVEVSEAEVTGRRATMEGVQLRPDGKEEDGRYRKVVSLDEQTESLYILLEGDTWIRCRRATLEGKLERAAPVSVHKLVVFDDL